MSIVKLTLKQDQALSIIQKYFQDHGYTPTLQEIGTKMGINSISAVHKHITALREKGFLKNLHKSVQSINLFEHTSLFQEIPLMGKISAGAGIVPIENPEPIQVQSSMVSGSSKYYALKVEGESMIDDGIFNGDIVVIRSQSIAESGDTVIAIINDINELATIKKLFFLKDKIELRASNSKLKDWPRQFDFGSVEIRGKFCGLIRQDK